MSYVEVVDTIESYNVYYNTFKFYTTIELLDLCEKNRLSIYGEKEILADRLALYYSEKNKPNRLTTCMKSIKQIFFK